MKNPEDVLNSSFGKMNKSLRLKDIIVVVTECIFLYMEPDHKIKQVARLLGWASLASLEQIKRNKLSLNSVNFYWRQQEEDKP